MATPVDWGTRFTSKVWNFFRRSYSIDPTKARKSDMTSLLKRSVDQKQRKLFRLPREDADVLRQLAGKDGKLRRWKGTNLFSEMRKLDSHVRYRQGKPYLSFKWTEGETDVLRRFRSPKMAYDALVELDSPHSYKAVAAKMRRLK